MKVNYTDYPMNISNFKIFGRINVANDDGIITTFNDTDPRALIGGITRKLERQVTVQELFLIYEGNTTVNIAVEFYYSNTFLGYARIQGIANSDFCLITLTNSIVIDEYRITLSGSGTNTTQTLKLKLISFGVTS